MQTKQMEIMAHVVLSDYVFHPFINFPDDSDDS